MIDVINAVVWINKDSVSAPVSYIPYTSAARDTAPDILKTLSFRSRPCKVVQEIGARGHEIYEVHNPGSYIVAATID